MIFSRPLLAEDPPGDVPQGHGWTVADVHHYGANRVGRDFVVGDLHGCLEPLTRLLAAVAFHPGRDRLFSVGDLVDRGPMSLKALALLQQPWFHAVMGNHEAQLLAHLTDPQRIRPHDPGWLRDAAPRFSQRQALAGAWTPLLRRLPLVISVGEGGERFNVVHAELIDDGRAVSDATIDDWGFARPEKARQRALAGRHLLKAHERGRPVLRAHDAQRMSVTYCGHSIVDAPARLAQQVFLDRGAFLGANDHPALGPEGSGLVMVEPRTGKGWRAGAKEGSAVVACPITVWGCD